MSKSVRNAQSERDIKIKEEVEYCSFVPILLQSWHSPVWVHFLRMQYVGHDPVGGKARAIRVFVLSGGLPFILQRGHQKLRFTFVWTTAYLRGQAMPVLTEKSRETHLPWTQLPTIDVKKSVQYMSFFTTYQKQQSMQILLNFPEIQLIDSVNAC